MTQIRFAAPTSVEEAVGLLAEANGSARVLAGGTDLIGLMKKTAADITSVPQHVDGAADLRVDKAGELMLDRFSTLHSVQREQRRRAG